MKLLEWLKGKFSRDKPAVNNLYQYSGFPFFFGNTPSKKFVNETTALRLSAVYACVRIISESIAALPLHVYQYNDDGSKTRNFSHSLYNLLHNAPNEEMTSFTFRETAMTHLLLWGNSYSLIVTDGAGRIKGLYLLRPDRMRVTRSDTGEKYYLYQLSSADNSIIQNTYLAKNGNQIMLKSRDVLHIHGLGYDGLIGYSPIAIAKNTIGIAIACEEFGASFFANGARLSGVLEHPTNIKDPTKLRESWQAAYGGSENTGKVAILEEGMKYHQIGIPPDDAQFLDTRKFQVNEIARLFRIPPHLIGDLDKSSFNNIEQQSLEFVKYTLNPWIVRWEQALCKSLLYRESDKNHFIKFNLDGLLRGDYQSRMQGYATARQNGWLSANDIRELEDLNPIPDKDGGNLYLINGNMTKLSDAGIFGKKAGGNSEG